MIKLKSGKEIAYNDNIDIFFQNLLSSIIDDSVQNASEKNTNDSKSTKQSYNDMLLKEIMDNSIFVTHQIFEISKLNENLSKFLVSGFLFNNIVLSIPDFEEQNKKNENKDDETIH